MTFKTTTTKYFTLYIPKIQRLDNIPPRRRATDKHHGAAHIFARHVTEKGNLLSLLQFGRFRPSTLHIATTPPASMRRELRLPAVSNMTTGTPPGF